ncbi:MAG: hypothetical protein NC453_10255 [Muribaculum sp.]|nr:hypothetical protein [Muribaculum sp.]
MVKLVKNEYLAALVSVTVFLLLPNVNFTRMMIPFFWLGYFYEKIEIRLNHKYTLAISGGIMILCYCFCDMSMNYLSNPNGLANYSEFIIIGLSASIFWISLFRMMFQSSNSKSVNTLQNIGGISLGIYCSHELLYFENGWNKVYRLLPENNWLCFLICSLLILTVTIGIVKALDKHKSLRVLFLGKISH